MNRIHPMSINNLNSVVTISPAIKGEKSMATHTHTTTKHSTITSFDSPGQVSGDGIIDLR
jgi:hypothetical protein